MEQCHAEASRWSAGLRPIWGLWSLNHYYRHTNSKKKRQGGKSSNWYYQNNKIYALNKSRARKEINPKTWGEN